jgi:hypothetical protein
LLDGENAFAFQGDVFFHEVNSFVCDRAMSPGRQSLKREVPQAPFSLRSLRGGRLAPYHIETELVNHKPRP